MRESIALALIKKLPDFQNVWTHDQQMEWWRLFAEIREYVFGKTTMESFDPAI